ncbi:MAG: hypothetical protein LUE92_04555 [Clostridiales bacterium]|nr:hypothetical protein [Clostridiales bacterium]
MTKNGEKEIRYCKKCGCELVSTNKNKLCDHCRRERSTNIRKVLSAAGTVGSVALFIVTQGKHGGGNKI